MKFKKLMSAFLTLSLVFTWVPNISAAQTEENLRDVMVNGAYVSFDGDAKLQVYQDATTMVPIQKVLKAMGATVNYQAAEHIVNATLRGTTINFFENGNEIVVDKNGVKSVVTLPVAPIKANGDTLVPVRSLASCFDMSVSWDSYDNTVVIIDFEKLGSELDKDFTIFNKIMQHSYDPTKTYEMTETSTVGMKVKSDAFFGEMALNGSATSSVITNGTNLNMDVNMVPTYDLSKLTTIDPDRKSQIEEFLSTIADIDVKMIYDNTKQVYYMNFGELGATLAQMAGISAIDGDTWIKVDLNTLSQQFPDVATPMAPTLDLSKLTIGTILSLMFNQSDIYTVDTYEMVASVFDIYKQLASDKKFVVSGTAEEPTYTLKITSKDAVAVVLSAAFKDGALSDESLDFDPADLEKLLNFNLDYTTTLKANHASSYSLAFDYDVDAAEALNAIDPTEEGIDGNVTANIHAKITSEVPGKTTTDLKLTFDFVNLDGDVALEMTTHSEANTVITDKAVTLTPPADADTVDLSELLK